MDLMEKRWKRRCKKGKGKKKKKERKREREMVMDMVGWQSSIFFSPNSNSNGSGESLRLWVACCLSKGHYV